MHENAGMDMKLRDTTTPVGVARKIEVVAADLRLKYFFPGEPQLVLLMHGKVSRNDGFKPFMFQRNRAFAEKRSGMAHATVDGGRRILEWDVAQCGGSEPAVSPACGEYGAIGEHGRWPRRSRDTHAGGARGRHRVLLQHPA